MILRATLGISLQLVRNTASEAHAALTRALELAEHLGDPDYQLRILHTFWIYHMRIGEVRTAMALARRADPIAASLGDPVASATAESMLGISLHWAGEHEAARRRLECLLQEPPSVPRRHFVHRAGFDLYVVARYVLARILWVQGYPDQAMKALRESIEEARRLQNPVTLCSALALGGCALSMRTGDFDNAERLAAELVGYARRHALEDFQAYGKAAQEIVSLRKEGWKRQPRTVPRRPPALARLRMAYASSAAVISRRSRRRRETLTRSRRSSTRSSSGPNAMQALWAVPDAFASGASSCCSRLTRSRACQGLLPALARARPRPGRAVLGAADGM